MTRDPRRTRPWLALATLAVLALAALPALAQRGSGPGPTPLGRRGSLWQTDQQLSREALAQLDSRLAEMDDEQWRAEAVAWVSMEVGEEGGDECRLRIVDGDRVGSVDPGGKADLTTAAAGLPPWTITTRKKLPRDLKLVLTDVDSTEVQCRIRGELEAGDAYLGVFLHEGQLLCRPRAAGPGDAAG